MPVIGQVSHHTSLYELQIRYVIPLQGRWFFYKLRADAEFLSFCMSALTLTTDSLLSYSPHAPRSYRYQGIHVVM